MRLEGRIAIVTGAAKGVGRAITLTLAREGCSVAMLGRDEAAMLEAAADVEAIGREAGTWRADVREDSEVAAAVRAAHVRFGRLDILVNAAGVSAGDPAPVWEEDADRFRLYFDTNVLGTFLTMKHVLPVMIEQGAGRVVNIGGTFGFKGVAGLSLYAGSKWALRGLTRSAALEAGPHGINVNLVAPGGIEGPSLSSWMEQEAAKRDVEVEAFREAFLAGTALKRLSSPDDVANLVLFLASEDSRLIAGQDVLVDGGTIV